MSGSGFYLMGSKTGAKPISSRHRALLRSAGRSR